MSTRTAVKTANLKRENFHFSFDIRFVYANNSVIQLRSLVYDGDDADEEYDNDNTEEDFDNDNDGEERGWLWASPKLRLTSVLRLTLVVCTKCPTDTKFATVIYNK